MTVLASLPLLTEAEAIADRNRTWATGAAIPSWVNPRHVGLDQFFTRPEVAAACHDDLLARMRADHAPSMSTGSWSRALARERSTTCCHQRGA